MNHVLLAFLWIFYGTLHSVLANTEVKLFFEKKLGALFRYYRLAYNLFAFAGLVAIAWFGISLHSARFFKPTIFSRISGGLLAAGGLALMLICVKKYFYGLSGLFGSEPGTAPPNLIITGVHRFVRHPLYLGTFAFLWGLVILLPWLNLLVSAAVITAYTLVALKFEEQKLVAEFGEHYRAYQKKVPAIIPKL